MKRLQDQRVLCLTWARKAAVYALLAVFVVACSSSKQPDLWQSDEVLLQAWQQKTDQNIEDVSERQQDLLERFHKLEQLYVSLSNEHSAKQAEQATLSAAQSQNSAQVNDEEFMKIQETLTAISKSLEQLGERVYAVELAAAKPIERPVSDTLDKQADSVDGSFVEEGLPNVPVLPSAEGGVVVHGIHLGSYRSREQVPGAWENLTSTFSELDLLKPKLYVQNQEGIGTFLRLIAGPYETSDAAAAACERINQVDTDQYCRISEFQGEDL
ncbi:SPOR domain-containing protein [Kordiimonas sp. SCSIO 12610]|uniref:SPOR domain-containing protein n=1 Tax=Kordiimonas sp. SCSIO 12610 TaxID=2829597 RepID=UPI002108C351|nr:SPOR domain-containing protein [Kordiimonas sp. SCSIO 12610]UTW53803.1 SPOR domain-containing protein [Kordiimonas sp. SCSIO 12610]